MAKEKYIAVMGVTGAGKSSFIKLVTGDSSIKVGESLVSETQELGTYKFRHKDRTIVLVDTPGFDDTTKKDADVLKLLAEWLESIYKAGTKLTGIIYLHRISDDRMRGSSMRSMRMFRQLCGESFYRNLLLGTTCWSLVPEEMGERREKELMTDQNFWKGLIAKGAQFVRIPDDGWEAKELVYDLARMEPASLQIQQEMVDKHISFDNLSAAQTLDKDTKALRDAHEKEKRRLEEEHEQRVVEQNRKLEQRRLEAEREKQTKLLGFQLENEHNAMAESVRKFQEGLTNNTYMAKLYPLTNSLGITCDGCCKWIGNNASYTCQICRNGTFRLCSDCYWSNTVFCYNSSHHSGMERIAIEDGPQDCRHIKSRLSPGAILPCHRCSVNITGVFAHCCSCLDDNFNMCLECLTKLGTCKKSWSLSGHRLHAILRRQRHKVPPNGASPISSDSSRPTMDGKRQSKAEPGASNNRNSTGSSFAASKASKIRVNIVPTTDVQNMTHSLTLRGHTKPVKAVVFSPRNDIIASCGEDTTVRTWDSSTGSSLRTITSHKPRATIENVSFCPAGNLLASITSDDDAVQLWDVRTNKSSHSLTHGTIGYCTTFAPDGHTIVMALYASVQVWDLRSVARLHTLNGHKNTVNSVSCSPNGRHLASTGFDKTVQVWSLSDAELLYTINAHPGMMNYPHAVRYSPDGQTIASGALDCNVKLWNSTTGSPIRTLKSKSSSHVHGLAYSPDGKTIAVAQLSGDTTFWNGEEGYVVHSRKTHDKSVEAVDFSPDGKMLVTGSNDKTVRVWKF